MKILILGDIVGEEGLSFLEQKIQTLRNELKFNLLIVNAENVTDGHGLNFNHYKRLKKMNVNVITMGNHVFGKKEIFKFIDDSNIIRPLNIKTEYAKGYTTINYNGKNVLVMNLLGTFAMNCECEITNPFKGIKELVNSLDADYKIIDFHAESTSEKYTLAHYLDGDVNLIYGTHTHVQTADEQILPGKTMFITDVGMTGPMGGVLGIDKDIIIDRFINDGQQKFKVSKSSCMINGIIVDFVQNTIKRVNIK